MATIDGRVDRAYAPLAIQLRGLIHPIWSRENFYDPNLFVVLVPSLRLATHLLESPAAQLYCHIVCFGLPHDINNAAIKQSNPQFVPRKRLRGVWKGVHDLDDYDKQDVRKRLLMIAPDIHHMSKPLPGEELGTCTAMQPTPQDPDPRGSILRYDPEVIAALTSDQLSDDEKRTQIVRVACVLLHELGHAMMAWRFQNRCPEEAFLEDALVAEARYEFKWRLFGGVPELNRTKKGRLSLIIDEYPTLKTLPRAQLAEKCRDLDSLPDREWDRQWTMSLDLIRNITDDAFWADPKNASDPRLLIPKSLAHNIRQCRDAGKQSPVPPSVWQLFERD